MSTAANFVSKTVLLVFCLAAISAAGVYPESCGDDEDMWVDGKVSIGTSNTTYDWQLSGQRMLFENANWARLHFGVSRSGYTPVNFYLQTDNYWQRGIGFYNQATANWAMFVSDEDKVGIGVTDPSEELEVDGNVECDTVKADVVKLDDWILEVPDYVFGERYELPDLQDVSEYVYEHKHLPGVPSGAEIAESGVDIGQLNMTLLRKIEELTLYIIKQEDRIRRLEETSAADQAPAQ